MELRSAWWHRLHQARSAACGSRGVVAVDHATAELLGVHAAKRATLYEALEPLHQGARRCFGAIAEAVAVGLTVSYERGNQYVSNAFQAELAFLGIQSSPSRSCGCVRAMAAPSG
jgi:hypothetical protein